MRPAAVLCLLALATALAPAATAAPVAVQAEAASCPASLPACLVVDHGRVYVCVDTPGIVRCTPLAS